MSRSWHARAVVAGILAALFLAGCFEAGPSTDPESSASERFSNYVAGGHQSWYAGGNAYEGPGVDSRPRCAILIRTNAETNTGSVVFHLDAPEMDGRRWEIYMEDFHAGASESYKQGGIAYDFEAYGGGDGGNSLPRMDIENAGWGEAFLKIGPDVYADALGGSDTWLAEYRVVRTGVRDDDTGAVWNAAKSGPFDPQDPGDGLSVAGDEEVHFTLRSHANPPQGTEPVSIPAHTVDSLAYNEEIPILIDNRYAGANVTMTITVENNPTQELQFLVKDMVKSVVAEVRAPPGALAQTLPISFQASKFGAYYLNVTGGSLNARYSAEGTYTPPEELVLNFWWEDVLYDVAAENKYAELQHAINH